MSKRYGRNQRRAHRATIAHLTNRLEMESTAHMYLPGDGVPDLESIARITDWSVTEDGSRMGIVYRSATVSIEAPGPETLDLIYGQTRVQFKGVQYIIADGAYQHCLMGRVELQLNGVDG